MAATYMVLYEDHVKLRGPILPLHLNHPQLISNSFTSPVFSHHHQTHSKLDYFLHHYLKNLHQACLPTSSRQLVFSFHLHQSNLLSSHHYQKN